MGSKAHTVGREIRSMKHWVSYIEGQKEQTQ